MKKRTKKLLFVYRRWVDTSAWIEVIDGSAIGSKLAKEMPEHSQRLVPTIVQMELAKWLFREVGEDGVLAQEVSSATSL